MLKKLAAGLGALLLAACATPGGSPSAPSTPPPATEAPSIVDKIELRGTQGLIVAELAYNSAANAVIKANQVGLIKAGTPLAATIRDLNSKASAALEAARGARSATERATNLQLALQRIAELSGLTPKPNRGGGA